MRKTREVAIFVYRGSEFLLARRVPQGVWNVIAGQVEDDESFADAAARELEEETGLVAAPFDIYRWCSLDDAIELAHWPEMKAGFRTAAARLGLA
jgi:ADP-ribose pyrophosphatase YjhB (NUDIX family)